MNLTFFHIAKLLQDSLVVMETVPPWIHIIASNTYVKYKLKKLSYS